MSIEIDILNGDASWPIAKSLYDAVWPAEAVAKLSWAQVEWAHADLRVLIEVPSNNLVCHVGIYFRMATWNGRKLHVGGIGGVMTHPDYRGHGYASVAVNAAVQSMKDREDVQFALLFCEPHNFAFYQSRGWHPFTGEIYCEQPAGRVRFETMSPFVFDLKRGPREGVIDLCGLPW
jgi:aminoglycoside 2'-N-acetyltransferase I